MLWYRSSARIYTTRLKQFNVKYQTTHPLLKRITLNQGERVRLGNDRNDVDDFAQLLHDDDINRAERVTGGVDEEQAAVDARVLDVAVAHSGELLAEVRAVLVLDVLDNGVPAASGQYLDERNTQCAYHPSLLIWSPYPGVSTMLSLSLTPFSVITGDDALVQAATETVNTNHAMQPGSRWSRAQARHARNVPWSRLGETQK
jgi:hypothetical protein